MRSRLAALYMLRFFFLFAKLGQCIPGGCLSCASQPLTNGTNSGASSRLSSFTMPSSRAGPPPTPPDLLAVPAGGPREQLPGGLVGDRIRFLLEQESTQTLSTDRFRIQCGTHNNELRNALFGAMQALAATLNDFTNPPYDFGFPVLFDATPSTALHVLEQLARIGDPVTVTDRNRPREEKPLFLCATQEMLTQYGFSKAYYSACLQKPYWPAYHVPDSHVTVVCPSFWDLAPSPPRSLCPPWDYHQQMWVSAANAATLSFRPYALLQQLLLMSMTPRVGGSAYSPPFGWINWNAQSRLPTGWKEKDPTNYLLYAALVHQQCRIAPRPGIPAWPSLPPMGLADDGSTWIGSPPQAQSPRDYQDRITAQGLM